MQRDKQSPTEEFNKSAPKNQQSKTINRPKLISGFGFSALVISFVVLGFASYDGRSPEELLQEIDKRKEQCLDSIADMPPGKEKLAVYESCKSRVTEEVLDEVMRD